MAATRSQWGEWSAQMVGIHLGLSPSAPGVVLFSGGGLGAWQLTARVPHGMGRQAGCGGAASHPMWLPMPTSRWLMFGLPRPRRPRSSPDSRCQPDSSPVQLQVEASSAWHQWLRHDGSEGRPGRLRSGSSRRIRRLPYFPPTACPAKRLGASLRPDGSIRGRSSGIF